ncbi:MAG: fasciclin domain-containing protein, partial [Armatimonadetes bacterium]|nr:fasciclin domain-containing protein [Armatimonadota bacterium]
AAVAALPAADKTMLGDAVTNKAANQKILLKHVVFNKFTIRDLEKLDGGFPLATAAGDTLTLSKNPDGTVNVNSVPVIREDIKANNGVSHPVATVIK